MIVQSIYVTKTFKMIIEFEEEYRVWNIHESGDIDNVLSEEVSKSIELFLSAKIYEELGKVIWKNGFEVDFSKLFEESEDLELLLSPPSRSFRYPVASKPLRMDNIPKSLPTIEIERINKELLDRMRRIRYFWSN